MKKVWLIPMMALSLLTVQNANAAGKTETFYINSKLVDCVGVGPQKCMQVRNSPKSDWTLFYGGIEGFTFVPGYQYKLKVAVTKVKNPPADGSSLNYKLVKMLGKKK